MLKHFLVLAALAAMAAPTYAQDTVKIGFILPMTGQQQSTGKQIAAAVKLFQQQNGDTVAGVLKREDEKQLVLADPEKGDLTIDKAKVTARRGGQTAMPYPALMTML